MATRVFLLSADEKAVHVITQILDEQDIRFEHSSDPTFTLKRLAGQHFDVLVVDCNNAESAMQVFNSARASSLNKGAIAIAIVEGKAGVPNAFRLGASLVLTKPVSLDQARNTLRTAVGMTKKDAVEPRPVVVPPVPAAGPARVHAAVPVTPPPVVSTAPVVSAPTIAAPPAPAPPTPVAPLASMPAPVVPPTPMPVAAVPQVVTPKIADVPAPIKSPALLDPAPVSVPAVAMKEAVTPEKSTLTPVPAKARPALQLEETRVIKLDADAEPLISAEMPSSSITEKTPLSLSSAMLGSAVSDAAIDKLETELSGPPAESKTAKPFEMFAPVPKQVDEAAPEPLEEEPEDSAATLRASAVPAFGGLGKQPFAGIDTSEHRGRGLLIGALATAVVAGGFAAAWFYVPGFQKTVTWEYSRVHEQVFSSQNKPVPVAVQSHPVPLSQAPSPVPTTPSEPPASSASTDSQAPNAASPATATSPVPQVTAAKPAVPTSPVVKPVASTQNPNAVPAKNQPPTVPASNSPAPATGNASLINASATTLPAASPKPADLFEVPEDYADDQVIHRVHPLYPKGARAKKLQGTVVLQAIIDKQGKVDSLQLVSGDPLLAQAAADAVKQWRYKPYSHNGDPVEFQTRVTVDFKLP